MVSFPHDVAQNDIFSLKIETDPETSSGDTTGKFLAF
jgi:hypothetical protein